MRALLISLFVLLFVQPVFAQSLINGHQVQVGGTRLDTVLAGKLNHVDTDGVTHGLSVGWNGSVLTYTLDGTYAAELVTSLRASAMDASHLPIGNDVDLTYSSLVVNGTASKPDNREITASFGMTTDIGANNTDHTYAHGDKIALYAGTVCKQGSFNCWADNLLTEISPATAPTVWGGWISEMDMNNNSLNSGDTPGPYVGPVSGSNPIIRGLDITGASSKRSYAALVIEHLTPTGWNRGVVVQQSHLAAFSDYSNATTSFDMRGGHQFGLDGSNGTFSSAFINGPASRFVVNGAGATAIAVGANLPVAAPGSYAAQITNQNDAATANGLYVSNRFRAPASTVLSVGSDNAGLSPVHTDYFTVRGDGAIFASVLASSTSYANDAAAASGGVAVGQLYRNGSVVQIRVSALNARQLPLTPMRMTG